MIAIGIGAAFAAILWILTAVHVPVPDTSLGSAVLLPAILLALLVSPNVHAPVAMRSDFLTS